MKKWISRGIALLLLCCILLSPVTVFAETGPLDTSRDVDFTLCYSKDGVAFADYPVSIYRVAIVLEDGAYHLEPPFSDYPINIYGISTQKEWRDIADTISACVAAEEIEPYEMEFTDETGTVFFPDVELGLYFVEDLLVENDTGTYLFDHFMVYLPTPSRDGAYEYEVEAKPKCVEFIPKTEYSVTKLWKDDLPFDRPEEIVVDIYKGGELQETVLLDSNNGWTYSWRISADIDGIWTVMERDVPEGYEMTVSQNGGAFFITNTLKPPPDIPIDPDDTPDDDIPETGDYTAFLPWMVLLLLSGSALLVLNRRRG